MTHRTPAAVAVCVMLAATPLGGCIETAVVGGAAAGTSVALQERGVKGASSDIGIRSEIVHYWTQADQRFLSDLNLQIYEARVLVSGEVANEDLRAQAVQLAWKAKGVREVINEVEVGGAGGVGTYWRDSLIVRELDFRLLTTKGVPYNDVSIECFNGVVFMIGVADSQEEIDGASNVARNIKNVRKVVNYMLLKTDPRRYQTPPA
jgi:osmotically-inducible protein OsmY